MITETLERIAQSHGLLAVYLFGSQAESASRYLQGKAFRPEAASELDVAVVFNSFKENNIRAYAELYAQLAAIFEPFEVDLVFAQEHDALFQYQVIRGIRIYHSEQTSRGCDYEEAVMRMADDLSYKKKIMMNEIMEAIEDGYFRF